MGDDVQIGIFAADGERPARFLGCDDALLLDILYRAAGLAMGGDLTKDAPAPGAEVRRIGLMRVTMEAVEDAAVYRVSPVAKPEGGRKPEGAPGSWAVQSLVFDAETFTEAQARAWIAEHEGFGDYGVDATENSFRFRQYDPVYFSEYRMISIAPGVQGVYGRIAKAADEAAAKAALDAALAKGEAVHAFNRMLVQGGLRYLPGSAALHKADGGAEERFVLSLVLEPNDGQGEAPLKPDTQNDIYSEAEVRKACHGWMENNGQVDLLHSWEALSRGQVRVLESYLAPVGFPLGEGAQKYDIVKGSWLLALRVVDDALWTAVKSGELGAFSVGGSAVRTPVELPAAAPAPPPEGGTR